MAKFTARMVGAREIERKLGTLETRIAKKVTRQALRAGSKVIEADAEARAPVDKGLLRRKIKVRAAKRKRGRIAFNVQLGKGDFKGETFYGAFQELGWRVGSRKLGDARRKVEGRRFMTQAYETKKHAALAVIEDKLWDGIKREAPKG